MTNAYARWYATLHLSYSLLKLIMFLVPSHVFRLITVSIETHANIFEPHLEVSSLSLWAAEAVADFLGIKDKLRSEFLYRYVCLFV